VLQVIPRSLLVQPARRLPGPFTVNAAIAARSCTSGLRHRVPTVLSSSPASAPSKTRRNQGGHRTARAELAWAMSTP
jgi:hypothetical protein